MNANRLFTLKNLRKYCGRSLAKIIPFILSSKSVSPQDKITIASWPHKIENILYLLVFFSLFVLTCSLLARPGLYLHYWLLLWRRAPITSQKPLFLVSFLPLGPTFTSGRMTLIRDYMLKVFCTVLGGYGPHYIFIFLEVILVLMCGPVT